MKKNKTKRGRKKRGKHEKTELVRTLKPAPSLCVVNEENVMSFAEDLGGKLSERLTKCAGPHINVKMKSEDLQKVPEFNNTLAGKI